MHTYEESIWAEMTPLWETEKYAVHGGEHPTTEMLVFVPKEASYPNKEKCFLAAVRAADERGQASKCHYTIMYTQSPNSEVYPHVMLTMETTPRYAG